MLLPAFQIITCEVLHSTGTVLVRYIKIPVWILLTPEMNNDHRQLVRYEKNGLELYRDAQHNISKNN
jgi:hypothetical protein